MSPPNQFGSTKPEKTGEGTTCAQCEAMLPDWMDRAEGGELSAPDRAAFERHIATCAECSRMLADAQRGAALLQLLKSPRPEPSSSLLDRILAATSEVSPQARSHVPGAAAMPVPLGARAELRNVPPAEYTHPSMGAPLTTTGTASNVLPFRAAAVGRFNLRSITRTMMQPRLAMTAAMAFFSIALTLNLTGVRLNELSIGDLKPSNIRRTFYQADASVVRYYDNLRVVYELESRVQDLKRSNDNDSLNVGVGSPTNSKTGSGADGAKDKPRDQQRKSAPKAGSGTSQRHTAQPQSFQLAVTQSPGRNSAGEPAALLLLTSFLDRNMETAGVTLKEMKQKGVLA